MVRRFIDKSDREQGIRQTCSQSHGSFPRSHKQALVQVLGQRVHEKTVDLANARAKSALSSHKAWRELLRRELPDIVEESCLDSGRGVPQ